MKNYYERLIKNGKFHEFIGRTNDNKLIYGVMCADGLHYVFNKIDILDLLNTYPSDKYGWYWNNSQDRYIAEIEDKDTVSVNPKFVDYHFVECIYS